MKESEEIDALPPAAADHHHTGGTNHYVFVFPGASAVKDGDQCFLMQTVNVSFQAVVLILTRATLTVKHVCNYHT